MWIAWERFYFDAEITWPWLVLGNAFAGSIKDIQWYEFTGSLGGSLWIWICNIWIFIIVRSLIDGSWSARTIKAKTASVAVLLAVLLLPPVLSRSIYNNLDPDQGPEIVSGEQVDRVQQPVVARDLVSGRGPQLTVGGMSEAKVIGPHRTVHPIRHFFSALESSGHNIDKVIYI